jgi:hypothetical protein
MGHTGFNLWYRGPASEPGAFLVPIVASSLGLSWMVDEQAPTYAHPAVVAHVAFEKANFETRISHFRFKG